MPTALDDFGCWSGCIVEEDGIASMFYTGVTLDGDERRPSICRATSVDDLMTWTKVAGDPCIPEPPSGIARDAFRDPFVFRDDDGWSMLVGAGTSDGLGAVLLYRSSDLQSWTYGGPFLSTDEVARAEGADGPCWECPQLVRIGDATILIVSVVDRAPGVRPSHVAAFVGRVEDGRFVVEHVEQLGMGPDFYAPATTITPDGRRLLLGWIPEDPPQESSSRTWTGSMTFPRIVSLGEDGRLSLAIATEVTALRAARHAHGPVRLEGDAPAWRYDLVSQHFELAAAIDAGDASEIAIELLDGDDESPEVLVAFRPAERVLSVARRGIVGVAGRSSKSTQDPAGGRQRQPLPPADRGRVGDGTRGRRSDDGHDSTADNPWRTAGRHVLRDGWHGLDRRVGRLAPGPAERLTMRYTVPGALGAGRSPVA